MNIFLADLYNVYQAGRNKRAAPYTVPLGIGYLASVIKLAMPDCTVRLFRDPDKFLVALKDAPPDLVGFSLCSWNMDITRRILSRVRDRQPDVPTVAGGPCVDDTDDELLELFQSMPGIDYLVPNEGESGLLALVTALRNGLHKADALPGVAYIGGNGALVRGKYQRPAVVEQKTGLERVSPKQVRAKGDINVDIPSPYLDGTLDEFLDDGLVPIVQTMRGCPYQCHFCVSGATEWNAMRGFDLDLVEAEIEYALVRSGSKDLILTDENWGILGDRDVQLARFISDRSKTKGAPQQLYYYTAKIVTPASREIVEMVAPIAWISEFSMSFQSMNPETRQAIKRTNISFDKLTENIKWAREKNITTASEMIYGFPFETPTTFFDGIEKLMAVGINVVEIFPLLLFPGIDLASKKRRAEYGMETRHRLADNGHGVYDGGKLLAVQSEEIIYKTRWSTEDDFFTVRRYAFFQQIIQGRLYLSEFTRLCEAIGLRTEPLMRYLAESKHIEHPLIANIIQQHRADAAAELKTTEEEVYLDTAAKLQRTEEEVFGNRINLIYAGKIFSCPATTAEFLDIVQRFVHSLVPPGAKRELIDVYLSDILAKRIVVLNSKTLPEIEFASQFDYAKWTTRSFSDPSELLLNKSRVLKALVAPRLSKNLREFDPSRRLDLQRIFELTPSKFLLRSVFESEDASGIAAHAVAA